MSKKNVYDEHILLIMARILYNSRYINNSYKYLSIIIKNVLQRCLAAIKGVKWQHQMHDMHNRHIATHFGMLSKQYQLAHKSLLYE